MAPTTRNARVLLAGAVTAVAAGAGVLPAGAQLPPPTGPPAAEPPAPPVPPPSSGRLKAPRVVATGAPTVLRGSRATPGARVAIQIRRTGRWRGLATARVDRRGRYRLHVRPRRASLAATCSAPRSPAPSRPAPCACARVT